MIRRTIYEYHRVEIELSHVETQGAVVLTPLERKWRTRLSFLMLLSVMFEYVVVLDDIMSTENCRTLYFSSTNSARFAASQFTAAQRSLTHQASYYWTSVHGYCPMIN